MSEILIRRPGLADRRQSIYIDFTAPRGTFIMRDPADTYVQSTNRPKAKLASGYALGILARDVNTTGPTLEDMAVGWPAGTNETRAQAEIADKQPGQTGLDPLPLEVEYEEVDAGASGWKFFITAGTGLIGTGTAAGTELAIVSGYLRAAQTGDIVMFKLQAQLTPAVAGNCRILVEQVASYKK